MKENHFLDDGTYSASQIIIEMVKRRLEGQGDVTVDLLQDLQEPVESREFRLRIKVQPFGRCSRLIMSSASDMADPQSSFLLVTLAIALCSHYLIETERTHGSASWNAVACPHAQMNTAAQRESWLPTIAHMMGEA